jgi:hypothetical protein
MRHSVVIFFDVLAQSTCQIKMIGTSVEASVLGIWNQGKGFLLIVQDEARLSDEPVTV